MGQRATTTGFVDVLDDPRLLPRAHFHELVTGLLPRCDDWHILARELVYREWLSPFQARRLLQGRGRDLVVGSYVLLDPIGEGAMGRVYRARNWKLGTAAAVKVIRQRRSQDPAAVERFLREVRALGAIRHPHVVHALDADVERGRLYYAMEFVPGTDLGKLLAARGALPVDTACRYAGQLADGLGAIAAHGLVHRDVKPGNVLVTADGSQVRLVDLGLARFDHPVWEGGGAPLTQAGIMIGTPDYVSPEQIRDSRRADIRSDLYSLGCTLYHMLTGRPPFDGQPVDKLCRHQTADPVPVEQYRPDVPPEVAAAVGRLMAKRPRDRYQDPAEVAAVLRPYHLPAGDTLTDAASPTAPGIPIPAAGWDLPRTDEIPQDWLPLVTAEPDASDPDRSRVPGRLTRLLNRLHWLIAALIAGAAMGFVIGRE